MREYRSLNLGCGELHFPYCLNVDIRKTTIVDVLVDLDKFPYPFKDEQFESVYAFDIVEHLHNVIFVMEEIHRVLKLNGEVQIHTSYWRTENSFTDPTHIHFFTLHSFDFFDPSTFFGKKYGYYSQMKFKVMEAYVDGQELMFKLRKI